MLSYESLYNAPVDKLKSAVDEWTDMINKLTPLGPELTDTVTKPLRSSDWQGSDANAAFSFIAETTKEFDDAVKEATGVRDILHEAYGRFKEQRDELHKIADHDAPARGLKVDGKGEVTANPPFRGNDPHTWRGKDTPGEAVQDGLAAIAAIKKKIERARANATEADDTAAWALHVNLGGEQHDFNPPKYVTLATAWTGGLEGNFTGAQDYIYGEMMNNIDSAAVREIKELLASDDPLKRAAALALWANKVAPGHEWDHKPKLRDRYGLETVHELYFKDPSGKRVVSYDIWSNIHYGYVGRAAGLSRFELENGAQVPVLAGNTDEGDKITVRAGEEIYDKYGPNLTKEQFQQEVIKVVDRLEKAHATQVKPYP